MDIDSVMKDLMYPYDKDFKTILKTLKQMDISTDRIKSISMYWEKVFPDKAFPRVEVKLYKK